MSLVQIQSRWKSVDAVAHLGHETKRGSFEDCAVHDCRDKAPQQSSRHGGREKASIEYLKGEADVRDA